MKKNDVWWLFMHSLGVTIILVAAVMFALGLCAILSGCKGQERIVYRTRTDSIYFARTDTFVRDVVVTNTDTVRLRDSVFIERINTIHLNEHGDTVWRDRIVFRDRWHDAAQTSVNSSTSAESGKTETTISKTANDSIYIYKEVEKPRTLVQRVESAGGWLAFIALLIVGVVAYIRNKK